MAKTRLVLTLNLLTDRDVRVKSNLACARTTTITIAATARLCVDFQQASLLIICAEIDRRRTSREWQQLENPSCSFLFILSVVVLLLLVRSSTIGSIDRCRNTDEKETKGKFVNHSEFMFRLTSNWNFEKSIFLFLSFKFIIFAQNVIKCNNKIDDGKHDSPRTNGTEDLVCSWEY